MSAGKAPGTVAHGEKNQVPSPVVRLPGICAMRSHCWDWRRRLGSGFAAGWAKGLSRTWVVDGGPYRDSGANSGCFR